MLPKVVLYNPRAVFWTMPLALIAIGSAIDRSKYSVVLVDGRLESDPADTILRHLRGGGICLGITVLTGAPIKDALVVSRTVKRAMPDTPIIWGGWHPSIFPEQCLGDYSVDAVVTGQGEVTFAEIVERLANGRSLDGLPGCLARDSSAPTPSPQALRDINYLSPHDYGLVDVEQYFKRKGKRQFDYVSSQGCRFRCTFCADPTVFKRGWYGLAPDRIAGELSGHHRTHRFDEIAFQDETFFTSPGRVEAIAEGFLRNGLAVDWTATMRSDQGSRMDDRLLALCRRAGLKRVMIGVESGSLEILQMIRKDITLEQVFDSAEKCARHGIGAILNFIVGFPGESESSIRRSLDVATELRRMSPAFEVAIFYFRPYPGTPLAEMSANKGRRMPDTLEAWADFDYIGGKEDWVSDRQWRQIERFKFYQRYAFGPTRRRLLRPLQLLSRWRIDRRIYSLPLEKLLVEKLRPSQELS